MAVGEVVHVLHAHDLRDALCLGDLLLGGVADPEVADQALLLEFHERLERLGERAGLGTFGVAESEVDQVEYVEPEGLEVVVDLAAQILGAPGRGPAPCSSRVAPTLVTMCSDSG